MNKFKKYLSIILLFLVYACAGSDTRNSIILERPEEAFKLQYAYLDYDNNRIYLKQKIHKDNYILSGQAENLLNPKYIDRRILGEVFIKLDLLDSEDKEEEIKSSNNILKLKAINKEEYNETINKVTREVIYEMIPSIENKGIILIFKDKEIVFYRDKDYKVQIAELIHKPDNVKIIEYCSREKYLETVFNELKKYPNIRRKMKNNLLLFEGSNEFLEYSIGFLDFKNNDVYYVSYSRLKDLDKNGSSIVFNIDFFGSFFLKSHLITPIKNPATSSWKLFSNITSAVKKFFQDIGRKNYSVIPPVNSNSKPMDLDEFEKLLDRKISKEVYKANMDILIGGEEFFPELINSIQEAQEYINIRVYIFDNDEYALKIADLLKKRSNEGIDVRVLKDSLANIAETRKPSKNFLESKLDYPSNMKKYIKKDSQVKARTSANVFLTFDHAKSMVFDDEVAYVGGMNIGKEYRYLWHDMMIKLEGKIVKPIKKEFDKSWTAQGWTGDAGLLAIKMFVGKNDENVRVNDDMIDVRLLYTRSNRKEIFKSQMYAIKNAKKYIYIENPYLSDMRIIKALIKARQRGVDVRVILPEETNVPIMQSNNMAITNLFIRNGVRVYHYPAMTHIKASIYDGWASVGSANFDRLSFDRNSELNISFYDKDAVEELKGRLFENDFSISREIKEPVKIFWRDRRLRGLANYL